MSAERNPIGWSACTKISTTGFENHAKHMYTVCVKDADFLKVKEADIYINTQSNS